MFEDHKSLLPPVELRGALIGQVEELLADRLSLCSQHRSQLICSVGNCFVDLHGSELNSDNDAEHLLCALDMNSQKRVVFISVVNDMKHVETLLSLASSAE